LTLRIIFWLSIAGALALGLALALTPIVRKGAGALRLFDSPDGGRRMHLTPAPRVGGVAVFLVAAIVATLLFLRTSPLFVTPGPLGELQMRILMGTLIGAGLLFLVGLVDDLRGLSPTAKSAAQVLATLIVYQYGLRIDGVALGYGEGVPVGMLEIPLLLLWIVGVTNAYNFIDGLHGLAAGIAIVACATIVVVALSLGNFFVLIPAVALGGALLGFLPYNFPNGRIFLGDSGSLSIGFLLAVLSIQGSVNRTGAVLVIVPILAVSIPLLDATLAILRRWLRHVPVSGADARHIHHRLLALGMTPTRTAVILWILAAGMAGLGLLIALTAPFVAASIAILGVVAVAVMVIYGTNVLSYHELTVAGEVLISAPSRARRVISDQIIALDLTAQFHNAQNVAEVSEILSAAALQFGFLGMELTGPDVHADRMAERVLPAHWAWKLDYPIRTSDEARTVSYVLSIWCSPEQSTRPYGAERVARVLGPALQRWFENHGEGLAGKPARVRQTPASRRLRIT
jgi:UDP-GlcNAc:undecaprenyl-phosphate GlcNAc-1-phosphate transferase